MLPHDRGGWVDRLQNDSCTPRCAFQASLAPQFPQLESRLELIRQCHSALWLTQLDLPNLQRPERSYEFSKNRTSMFGQRKTFLTILYTCKSIKKRANSARQKVHLSKTENPYRIHIPVTKPLRVTIPVQNGAWLSCKSWIEQILPICTASKLLEKHWHIFLRKCAPLDILWKLFPH